MASGDKELAEQLTEAGNALMDHSSNVEELLPLLDQVENCLSRVEQSPRPLMQKALTPSLKALMKERLFKHSDPDIKVAVAACISEITRITAPEAPYDDEKMKEVFQLIVSSFENLFDKSSRSYSKRTSILDTVAKVRSCVVMLDLECDMLITEMFQHFLKSIRDYHPESVFTSMETIMTLVLEESEDISMELLSLLISSVKRDNEEVLPIARKLAECVLENCASKLKPYLTVAVKKLGISVNDCTKIVSSICHEPSGIAVQNDVTANEPVVDDGSKPAEESLDEKVQENKEILEVAVSAEQPEHTNENSPKSILSNNIPRLEEVGTSNFLEKPKGTATPGSTKKVSNTESKGEKIPSPKLTEPSDGQHDEKEDEACSENKSDGSEAPGAAHEEQRVDATEDEKEIPIQPPSPKAAEEDESAGIDSPKASEKVPNESHPKQKGRPKKKMRFAKKSMPSAASTLKKKPEETNDSENRRSGKKVVAVDFVEDKTEKDSETSDTESVGVASSPIASEKVPDESHPKRKGRPKKKMRFAKKSTPSAANTLKKKSEETSDSENSEKKVVAGDSIEIKPEKESETSDAESAGIASTPIASEKVPDESHPKKKGRPKKKMGFAKKSTPSSANTVKKTSEETSETENRRSGKKVVAMDFNEDKSGKESETSGTEAKPNRRSGKKIVAKNSKEDTKKESETSDTEAKPNRRSGKKVVAGKSNEDKTKKESETSDTEAKPNRRSGKKAVAGISIEDKAKKESESDSDSEATPIKQVAKKVDVSRSNADRSSLKQQEDRRKRSRGEDTSEKRETKISTKTVKKETVASPKSVKQKRDESDVEEAPKTGAKRKLNTEKNKDSGSKEYGQDLVGSRIKVWWPDDEEYYQGAVSSYDPKTKKHMVDYDDGDRENLFLKTEKWELIRSDSESDEEDADQAIPETPLKKKAKTSEHSTKLAKTDISPKTGGGSSSKSKGAGLRKADRKSKTEDDDVSSGKETKTARKSKTGDGNTSKSGKSKEESLSTPKASKKVKLEQLMSPKPRGRPPKSSGKSNGSSKLKSSSSKEDSSKEESSSDSDKEDETVKSKPASSSKRGRKRRVSSIR